MINKDPNHKHTYDAQDSMTCCSLEEKIDAKTGKPHAHPEHDHDHADGEEDEHEQIHSSDEKAAWKLGVPQQAQSKGMRQTKTAFAMRNLFKAYRKSCFSCLQSLVFVPHPFHFATQANSLYAAQAKGLSHPLQFARAFVTAASFVLQATSLIALRLPGTLPLR